MADSGAAADLGVSGPPLPTSDPRTKQMVLQTLQQHEKDIGVPMEKWSGKEVMSLQKKLGATSGRPE